MIFGYLTQKTETQKTENLKVHFLINILQAMTATSDELYIKIN